ncbi:MAG: hypothetical protein M9938_08855 [Solirubrobacterales bacterium]|nr:hypothetical protein [Solirubrobacterales bacterium]
MENLKTKGAVAATVLALGGLAGVALASNDGRSSTDPSVETNRQRIDRPEATGPDAAGNGGDREHSELAPTDEGTSPPVTSSSGGSEGEEGHDYGERSRSQDDNESDHDDSDEDHDDDDD